MASITLRGVAKRYGETRALEETDLEIADHEFLVLVGPSGSGKTTLLRAIAGLETVTEGDIYFGDRRVTDVDVSDRDIAMVFQNYGLYPHMTVYANMAFGLRRRKIPRPEIAAKVRQTATLLGIETLLERKPRQLSGGQRQRVALGRAIVRDPAVFLLDEPLSNLDAHLRAAMRAEILKVHRAVTATAVYVTHDQVEAMTMGDRIAVMQGGLIQQLGTPADLYDHPASQFVAGFIGTPAMGFLTCHRTGHADHADHAEGTSTAGAAGAGPADGTAWHAPGVRLQLTPEQTAALPEGTTRLVAGIRPEHLQPVSAAGRDQATCLIEGTVDVVEPLGADQHILVSTGDTTITVRRPREDHITRDQKIALTTDPARLHLFDTDTGRAYRQ